MTKYQRYIKQRETIILNLRPDFELWAADALRILLIYTGLSESVVVAFVIHVEANS